MDERTPTIRFTSSRAILCEGEGDRSFFRHLIQSRHLPEFDIFCPGKPYTEGGAVEGYDDMLTVFTTGDGFQNLAGILIQGDNDDDPGARFTRIQEKVRNADGYAVPNAPLQVAKVEGRPALVVMMFPWTDEIGSLETLCLPSAEGAHPEIKKCVDEHINCINTADWPIQKQHKLRLRCMIASVCRTDPYTSLVHAWSRPENLIPLNDSCFDRLSDFLRKFDNVVRRNI